MQNLRHLKHGWCDPEMFPCNCNIIFLAIMFQGRQLSREPCYYSGLGTWYGKERRHGSKPENLTLQGTRGTYIVFWRRKNEEIHHLIRKIYRPLMLTALSRMKENWRNLPSSNTWILHSSDTLSYWRLGNCLAHETRGPSSSSSWRENTRDGLDHCYRCIRWIPLSLSSFVSSLSSPSLSLPLSSSSSFQLSWLHHLCKTLLFSLCFLSSLFCLLSFVFSLSPPHSPPFLLSFLSSSQPLTLFQILLHAPTSPSN